MEPFNRYLLLQRLKQKNVKALVGTVFERVVDEGVMVADADRKHILKAESVVLALGSKSNNGLAKALGGKVKELYVAGDCLEPRKSLEAIHEGSWVARQI
jgi:2,4-dienoyl-CoA reductase (NADPH2)